MPPGICCAKFPAVEGAEPSLARHQRCRKFCFAEVSVRRRRNTPFGVSFGQILQSRFAAEQREAFTSFSVRRRRNTPFGVSFGQILQSRFAAEQREAFTSFSAPSSCREKVAMAFVHFLFLLPFVYNQKPPEGPSLLVCERRTPQMVSCPFSPII